MTLRAKILTTATVLATLSATCAYAATTDSGQQLGTWNDNSTPSVSVGSQISNDQNTTQTQWSNINGSLDTVSGDAAVQGNAAGNLLDVTTMNNTSVQNKQVVGVDSSIGSDINMNVSNVWGSVGISNQAVCNGASVSTDPTYAATHSYQACNAADPASLINTNVAHVANDVAIQGTSIGNSLEADSNAPNMPVWNQQVNTSRGASTVNANVTDVGGSTSVTSSAIGNTAQVIHYSTN